MLCGQGVAPAAATVSHLRDGLGLDHVPGTGLLAATVPGAWDGWLVLLRDHGTLTLREALGPALGYAASGFPLVPRVPATIATVAEHFRAHWPSSAKTWLPNGRVPEVGELIRLPVLAETWARLLAAGEAAGADRIVQIEAAREAWYRGFVAEGIEVFCRTPVRDETGRDHCGLLTGADLAAWSASYEDPVIVDVGGGWSVVKPAAWTQGPVLAQILQLLRGTQPRYVDGVATADTVHDAAEATKLAFADREAWYGDSPAVAVEALLTPGYADARRALITSTASMRLRPGSPDGRAPRLASHATHPYLPMGPGGGPAAGGESGVDGRFGLGEPTLGPTGAMRGDTVHLDVIDAAGNMISATPSGGWLHSSPTIPALGFCLGTRAQMFWLEEGLPSSLVPGRRPRTTLSPALALRGGEPALAFGTPGGDQQDQWQLCFWLAHIAAGLGLQAAIDAPTWHTTAFPPSFAPRRWEPGGLVVESRLGERTIAELARRGHRITDAGPWALGRVCAVGREGHLLQAAADRRSGVAACAAV